MSLKLNDKEMLVLYKKLKQSLSELNYKVDYISNSKKKLAVLQHGINIIFFTFY